jgi:hypothetical protein
MPCVTNPTARAGFDEWARLGSNQVTLGFVERLRCSEVTSDSLRTEPETEPRSNARATIAASCGLGA